MDWFDKAAQSLEDDLENGVISQKEFNECMRDLREEWRESNPQGSYDNFM